MADGDSGLRIISISDPANPSEVGAIDTPGSAANVALSGDYAYVADHGGGLRVIWVGDPAQPVETGHLDTPGAALDVGVSGDLAFVADGYSGLRVISIADSANPAEVGYYDTPGYAHGIAVSGDSAYVADGYGGVVILRYQGPTGIGSEGPGDPGPPRAFSLSQNCPNPFNPTTTIEVRIPEGPPARTSLAVYDLRGRLVRTLASGDLPAGTYRFAWNGEDDRGVPLPSGAYLYSLRNGGRRITRKMTLLK